jgi:hypothetical protein
MGSLNSGIRVINKSKKKVKEITGKERDKDNL